MIIRCFWHEKYVIQLKINKGIKEYCDELVLSLMRREIVTSISCHIHKNMIS